MRRPWHIWMVFGLCLVVVFGAMGWVSLMAIRVERAEARARQEAALEEKARLALWRMDSALVPVIARESGRQWVSWIHIADLVGMILFALDNEGMEGPVNGTAPSPVTNRELARTLAGLLGRRSWLPVPRVALRMALGEVADVIAQGQQVFPRKMLDAGYQFGYANLVDASQQILTR